MDFNIHIYHHNVDNSPNDVILRLNRIDRQIQLLGDQIMALDAAFVQRLDKATNDIAARFQALLDSQRTNLTDEQVAEMEADISRLEEMGKNPNQPLPPTP